MTLKPARTRIAPSPTGDPHVGTAYMALFNRALADKTGGQFLFRLDDTDQARRQESSEAQLYEALRWLGIRYDEGPDIGGPHAPYRQSERLGIYRTYVDRMLQSGAAYYCFATNEELETMRKIQQAQGRPTVYDRRWRGRDKAEVQAKLEAGEAYVIRVAMPLEGDVVFEDLLRGPIRIPAAELDDKVIWKSDGFPTYHLANVVDDHEFGITHILRGEEWIASVPLHVVMMEALGISRPVFIHMPLLRNADKSKVSKRRNPTSLLWYRDAGITPEGMLNFLGMMGFSLPDDQEIFSYAEFVQHFAPSKIRLGGPVFDLKKLEWCNGEQIRLLSDDELFQRLLAHISFASGRKDEFEAERERMRQDPELLWPDHPDYAKAPFHNKFRVQTLERNLRMAEEGAGWLGHQDIIRRLVPLLKTRMHTLSEAADYLPPFFEELPELPLEDLAAIKKFDDNDKCAAIRACTDLVKSVGFEAADAPTQMEEQTRQLVEGRGWKIGPVFMTLRLAALRAKISPPLFESMQILGLEVTLKRLGSALAQLERNGLHGT